MNMLADFLWGNEPLILYIYLYYEMWIYVGRDCLCVYDYFIIISIYVSVHGFFLFSGGETH